MSSNKFILLAVWMIFSSKVSSPMSFRAEILAEGTFPPTSSNSIPNSSSYKMTSSGFDSGRSILFKAITIGIPYHWASFITSAVYCWIPSTVEMTTTMISVTLAPHCLISLKASCPGVSMNVISFPLKVWNENAPMV